MTDQVADNQALVGDQIENRLNIATLGPPNIADWIIDRPILISGVVSTRAIGAREAHGEFFRVKGPSIEVKSNIPEDNDRRSIPSNGGGPMDGVRRRGRGSNDDGVCTPPSAPFQDA